METGTQHVPTRQTRLDRLEAWFRNQLFFSILILVGISIVGTSEVMKGGSDLLESLGLKQEKTLQLAADTAKGDLSRRLTELVWRRLFWTENYLERARLKRPAPELEYSWNKHLDAVAEWSSEYMVNLNGMDKFYPGGKKTEQFEQIHRKFRTLEYDHVLPLRLSELDGRDHSVEIAAAKALADEVNTDLYFFVLNRSDR